VASRKDEQQRRRAERLAAEQRESQAARRRLMVGYIVAGALALAIVVGLVIVLASGDGGDGTSSGDFPAEAHIQAQSGSLNGFEPDDREGTEPPAIEQGDLQEAARAAGCELDLDLEIEGNTHIPPDAKEPKYGTSPPTSGDHVVTQQADGAYIEQPDDVFTLHSLEHGRVNIQYSPDLSESEQLELKGVFDEEPAGMLFFPNEEMPYEVAATAWGQLMGCDTYEGAATLDAIRAFRETYRGLGPEEVPIVTG
jgi:hypothetical protein